MIADIVFFVGGLAAREPLEYFRWVHRQFLADSGVVSVYPGDATPPRHCTPKDIAALLDDPAFAPTARERLKALHHNRPEKAETLLVQNVYLHKKPLELAVYSALCRFYFPDAQQRAVFIASPADKEVEATCTSQIVLGAPLVLPLELRWRINNQPGLESSFTKLEEQFGKDAVTIIPFENEEQVCRDFTAAVVSKLPDTANGLASLSYTPSPVDAVLSRDVLAFMSGVNQLFVSPGSGQCSPHTWRKFDRFLCGVTPSQLFSPEARAELRQKLDSSDIKALAKRNLHPWIRPSEYPGLTDDVAFHLASLLPQEHVDTLLKGPHLPEQYQAYDARLCLQALNRVRSERGSCKGIPRKAAKAPAKLSVLTLTYNQANYIGECIESIIAQQTDFPIQHIIADKGSSDGTQDIVMDYAAKYPHIVPLFQKSSAPPAGERYVLALFEMARSEYVALCDGDDYFTDPGKLQIQVDLLDAKPEYALCFHPVHVAYEDAPERDRLFPPEQILPRGVRPYYHLVDLLRNNFIQTNTVVYRWRFRHGMPDWFRPDMRIADRYWHLLHAEMGKIGFINKVMSVYRRHKSSLSYLSDFDPQKYRAETAMLELKDLDIINRHFNRKYDSILLDLTSHIFADCVLYDQRQEEAGLAWEPVLDKLAAQYPDYARHFLASLNLPRA